MSALGSGGPQERTAIVLFNLGGPDRPEAVEPFLRNLFSDPAILRVPGPLRWLLARLISKRRAPIAQKIYAELGGGSPILPNTEAQATALQAALNEIGERRVFIAMRYWHPRAAAVAREVAAWKPTRIVLLPLYPQFSTTTTQSSFEEWAREAAAAGLAVPTRSIRAYADEPGFVAALAQAIRPKLAAARAAGRPRLLLSAHGLPKKIVAAGDPYQREVEKTAAALRRALADEPDLDAVVCYQSRVGPLEWIGPSTQSEVERAGRDRVPVVMAPIAFVSEHSETLVELDVELRHVAEAAGVPLYLRVPTVDVSPEFIGGLARLVRAALKGG
jgi:protoporphyrin/coproporphyrin ferrochelatase